MASDYKHRNLSGGKVRGIVLGLLLLCSCTATLLVPTEADVNRAKAKGTDTDLAALSNGRALYVKKCNGCHMLYNPPQHTREQWVKLLPEMGGKAKLTEGEYRQIEQYLVVMCEAAKAPK